MTHTLTIGARAPIPITLSARPMRAEVIEPEYLLDLMQRSSFFDTEERRVFALVQSTWGNERLKSMTYVLVHLLQAAIVRHGNHIIPLLFEWEDQWKLCIREQLIAEGRLERSNEVEESDQVERYIKAFQRQERKARDVQGRLEDQAIVQTVAERRLLEQANGLNGQIIQGAETNRRHLLSVHVQRQETTRHITAMVGDTLGEQQRVAEQLTTLTRGVAQQTEQIATDDRSLGVLLNSAEQLLSSMK